MSAIGGPNIVEDGLVLALDAANTKGISPASNEVYNGASQFVKNLVNKSDSISANNGVKLGNINYYTAFAIDYPEGNFGGAAAHRQGITPGFNVTSGAKTYDASRALHLWVWNNSTNTWLSSTYFNGLRLSGHCYDSHIGTAEVNKWVDDYTNIKNTFDDITVIAAGSHRDSHHTTAQYDILRDLGAPSNVNSIIGFSSPEWILVGKPGLGAGNAYGWSFQNYTTDPTRVAHLNFGLPIYGTKDNYWQFDGIDTGVQLPGTNLSVNQMTISSWNYSLNYQQNGFIFEKTTNGNVNTQYSLFYNSSNNSIYYRTYGLSTRDLIVNTTSAGVVNNQWNNIIATWDGTNKRIYVNGTLRATSANLTGTVTQNTTGPAYVGIYGSFGGYPFNGRVAAVNVYNRALTAQEVLQNYTATKSRYGL